MPKQLNSDYNEVAIPFVKMNYVPDVPSAALGPNEYNYGRNVETDVRGIRSCAGDQEILLTVPGTPTYVSSGFRQSGQFWFIVATTEGNWYASNGGAWQNITPGGVPFSGYAQNTNITESWNGTVPFFNDTLNPPMFLPDEPGATLIPYSNQAPLTISDIEPDPANPTTQRIVTLSVAQPSGPFTPGTPIKITDSDPPQFNGEYVVVSSTGTTVTILCTVTATYSRGASISPKYVWNYNPNWKGYFANFMRLYSTPNVGSILVAGNLTATSKNATSPDEFYPVTVQWSQAFGLNQAPLTWEPTVTNVANQLEVPMRGPALDAFPCNGQFFLCSYWDTVVFSPINYSTTSAPILGVRLFNQGRGLLSSNCWANTDKLVYGIDARDVWVFDGQDFQGLGNQQVKNWLFDQIIPEYYDRVFMEVNTQKNQVEIYYTVEGHTNGVPNRMLSYRYDLQVWNAPRDVASATMACESPIYTGSTPNLGSRTVVYARGVTNQKLVQMNQGYTWHDGSPIVSQFKRENIKLLKDYSGKLMIHRVLPEVVNLGAEQFTGENDYNIPVDPASSTHKGNVTITISGANSVGSTPVEKPPVTIPTDASGESNQTSPWAQINQNAYRVNNIEISNSSNNSVWMCTATTWQFTQIEDDR